MALRHARRPLATLSAAARSSRQRKEFGIIVAGKLTRELEQRHGSYQRLFEVCAASCESCAATRGGLACVRAIYPARVPRSSDVRPAVPVFDLLTRMAAQDYFGDSEAIARGREVWRSFDATSGELPAAPDLDRVDGLIITGSSHTAHSDLPWIEVRDGAMVGGW
jgi:hypothetical protein